MIVTVVFATIEVQDVVAVEISPGATLASAVQSSGLLTQYGLDPAMLEFAVFGVLAGGQTRLADGDRVEIVRPIVADPKVARARRARTRSAEKHARKASGRGSQ